MLLDPIHLVGSRRASWHILPLDGSEGWREREYSSVSWMSVGGA
jgi:hypothetical protein